MLKVSYLALIMTLACFLGAGICPVGAAEQSEPPLEFEQPDPAQMRKLSAPISKKAIMDTLMADPKTKGELLQARGKLGAGALSPRSVSTAPLTPVTGMKPVGNPNEEAYQALDWQNGITFSLNSIPTYGPRKYKLGSMSAYPCRLLSGVGYTYLNPGGKAYSNAAALDVELPTEPVLYTITVRLTRLGGDCYPGWLTPKPGASTAPITCTYIEKPTQEQTRSFRLTLTPLPDGHGYVGIVSANPKVAFHTGAYNMRKATAKILLGLNPTSTRPGEQMGSLIFHDFTITRL